MGCASAKQNIDIPKDLKGPIAKEYMDNIKKCTFFTYKTLN